MSDTRNVAKSPAKDSAIRGPIIVLIRGLPGSGKSYLSNALRDKFGVDKVIVLDPDAINQESPEYKELSQVLTSEGIGEKFHPYRFLRAQAHQGITNRKIIIWNQPFSEAGGFERTIESLRLYAGEHKTHSPILLVEVDIIPEVAKARVAERKEHGEHGPSPTRFDTYVSGHTSFAGKGQDHTITVQGRGNVSDSVETVIKAMQELVN